MKDVTSHSSSSQPPKLLDQLRRYVREHHYSLRTERAYAYLARWYIRYHQYRHPIDMAEPEIRSFMSYLIHERQIAGATYTQALFCPFVSLQEGADQGNRLDRRREPP